MGVCANCERDKCECAKCESDRCECDNCECDKCECANCECANGSEGRRHASSSSLLLSSLELSDTKVYEPEIRTLLGTAAHFCKVVAMLGLKTRLPAQRASGFGVEGSGFRV